MRELLGARERFRDIADDTLASARSKLEELERKRARIVSNSLELDLSPEEGQVVRDKLESLRQQIATAKAKITKIEEQTRSDAIAEDHPRAGESSSERTHLLGRVAPVIRQEGEALRSKCWGSAAVEDS
jgi:predicted  nucleic acid-binding Zn-ribbon protein